MSNLTDAEKVKRKANRKINTIVDGYDAQISLLQGQLKHLSSINVDHKEEIKRRNGEISFNVQKMQDLVADIQLIQELRQESDVTIRQDVDEIGK